MFLQVVTSGASMITGVRNRDLNNGGSIAIRERRDRDLATCHSFDRARRGNRTGMGVRRSVHRPLPQIRGDCRHRSGCRTVDWFSVSGFAVELCEAVR